MAAFDENLINERNKHFVGYWFIWVKPPRNDYWKYDKHWHNGGVCAAKPKNFFPSTRTKISNALKSNVLIEASIAAGKNLENVESPTVTENHRVTT